MTSTAKTAHIPMAPPSSQSEALDWLTPLLDHDAKSVKTVPQENFKRAWLAIAFMYAGLHPDGSTSREGGIAHTMRETGSDDPDVEGAARRDPRLLAPYYEESGWPVVLVPLAEEAARRYDLGRMEDDEYYPVDAQRAGMRWREQRDAGATRAIDTSAPYELPPDEPGTGLDVLLP